MPWHLPPLFTHLVYLMGYSNFFQHHLPAEFRLHAMNSPDIPYPCLDQLRPQLLALASSDQLNQTPCTC